MFRTESFRVGLDTLRANPLRATLSTLGVVMGVGSMVAVLAVGDGVERFARAQLAQTTDLQAIAIIANQTQRLDGIAVRRRDVVRFGPADIDWLRAAVPEAEVVDLVVQGGAFAQRADTSRIRGVQVIAMASSVPLDARMAQRGMQIGAGRSFTTAEAQGDADVTVLAASTADSLGGGAGLVGQRVRLQQRPFTVIGVLAPEAGSQMAAYVPFGAAGRVLGGAAGATSATRVPVNPPQMQVVVRRVEDVAAARRRTEQLFARRFGPAWAERVSVVSNSARVDQATQGLFVFKILMGAITGVSLLVGGIGIMNVLLASVVERTREIGVRKAAGARQRDILVQFLAESVTITSAGAAVGVALGLGIAFLTAAIMRAQTQAPVHAAVTLPTIAVAGTASIIVGLVFGLYPAMRAARLSPIEAIRHE